MKHVLLFSNVFIDNNVFFYLIIIFDFFVYSMITLYNFFEKDNNVSNFQTQIFQYYFILMLIMTSVCLAHKIWKKKYDLFLGGIYSILRIFSYIFLIGNGVNLINEYRSDEIESHTERQKLLFTIIFGTFIVIYLINCRLSFTYHNMIDDYIEENALNQQKIKKGKEGKFKNAQESESDSKQSSEYSETQNNNEQVEEENKEALYNEVDGDGEVDKSKNEIKVVLRRDPIDSEMPLEKKFIE